MGVVLRAYDPKLHREVAIKLLRADILGQDARERMLREAQAMAQLSHPNVVAIHDVDEAHGEIALVMEYVRGQTLRKWLAARGRSWAQIVERFVEAGRGLLAAHERGVLHRDFKPSNVLVPDQGEAKVADFGLAVSESGATPSSPSTRERAWVELEHTVTPATIEGTPRYMAPEQHRGLDVDPRADQYSLCVALWEALAGAPPFAGKVPELEAGKLDGPPPWPSHVVVPRRLSDAIGRGLAPAPEDRWPSMAELLEAMAPERSRRGAVGLAAISLVALGALGMWWWGRDDARCTGAALQLRGVWDDARRQQVEVAITGTGVAYAPDVWSRVGPGLDEYARWWAALYTETCEATTLRGEQSVEVMDLRMACLRRSRLELEAAVEVLADADADVVERAHEVVDGLVPLTRCESLEALHDEHQAPRPEDEDAIASVHRALARSKAQREAGHYDDALRSVERAQASFDHARYEPLAAESFLERAQVLEDLGRYEDAEQALQQVLELGSRNQRWAMVRRGVLGLLLLTGVRRQQPEQVLGYRPLAEGLCHGDLEAEAKLYDNLASIAVVEGDYAEAQRQFRQALELRRQAKGPSHHTLASLYDELGGALMHAGRYAEAEAEHRRALAMRREHLGSRHPDVAVTLNNLASALHHQGRFVEAERIYQDALAVQQEALGTDHPQTATTLGNLGNTLKRQGRLDEAIASFRRTLAIRQQALGAEHPHVTVALTNLGSALERRGLLDEAETITRRALDRWERAHGPEHPNVALTLGNLAIVLFQQDRLAEAEPMFRRALALKQRSLGAEHPETATAHYNLAQVLRSLGEGDVEVETQLRQALTTMQRGPPPEHPQLAEVQVELGRTLLHQGKHAQAESELRPVLAALEARLEPGHPDIVDVQVLLAEALLGLARAPEARALAEQALIGCEEEPADPGLCGDAAFVRARAAWDCGGGERTQAMRWARIARGSYDQAGEARTDRKAEVMRWVERHR